MADTPKTVPLVASGVLTEFGHIASEEIYSNPNVMDRDQSYVPGWSELRRQRDTDMAEYARGDRKASDVRALPVNLRWARNQNKAGEPDSIKPFAHGRKGYRMVNAKADKGQPWFTELPPGSIVGADGTVRNGDTVLMVATAREAARNDAIKQQTTNERLTGALNSFAQNVERVGGVRKGADPTITKLPAEALGA